MRQILDTLLVQRLANFSYGVLEQLTRLAVERLDRVQFVLQLAERSPTGRILQ